MYRHAENLRISDLLLFEQARADRALGSCCSAPGSRLLLRADPSVVKDANVYNRPVLLLGNDKLEVAIVKQGGSMLRIQIQGDPQGISPFGNPELVPGVPDNRKLTGPMPASRPRWSG